MKKKDKQQEEFMVCPSMFATYQRMLNEQKKKKTSE